MAGLLIQLSLSHANHLQRWPEQGTRLDYPTSIISQISECFLLFSPVCLSICRQYASGRMIKKGVQMGNL